MSKKLCVLVLAVGAFGCVEKGSGAPSEKDMATIRDNVLATAPTMKREVNADLDGKLVYLGIDYDKDSLAPGETMTVKHYFKVVNPTGAGWKLFTHLNGDAKSDWVNVDHVPVKGKYQVGKWKAGEIIRDEHKVTLPKKWSSSTVSIYVGVYKGGDRMKVLTGEQDGQNRLLALKLPVTNAAAAPVATKLPELAVRLTLTPPVIDGKLDDEAWKTATSTGTLVETLTGEKPIDPASEAKVLWDAQNLYVSFSAKDDSVWTDLSKRDDKLWTQDVFEVFLDADGDGQTYVELQVNPKNAVFDSFLPTHRANQNDWTAEGMKTAVQVDGTVDNKGDSDRGWTAEMAIPWAAVAGKTSNVKFPPTPGQGMRANFFRFDLKKDGKQVGAAWSPTIEPDFHQTQRFGKLAFADDKGVVPDIQAGVVTPGAPIPGTPDDKLTPAKASGLVAPVKKKAAPKAVVEKKTP